MRRRHRANIEDLRLAIDCLPVRTREAMLEGLRTNEIIVGGYTDGHGGVCPMLAAHRAGGRTNFVYFAKVWDRFAGTEDRTRRATERELRILTSHLEASLLDADGPVPEFARAIAEHAALLEQRGPDPTEPAEPAAEDRRHELRRRPAFSPRQVLRRRRSRRLVG